LLSIRAIPSHTHSACGLRQCGHSAFGSAGDACGKYVRPYIPNENGHFGHSTHTIFLYFFAIFSRLHRTNFSQIPQALFTELIGLALLFSLFAESAWPLHQPTVWDGTCARD
jgi:hypothetical protein